MRAYGVSRYDRWCCPGHDRFPRETYRNRRSKKAHRRDTKLAHRLERHRVKNKIRNDLSSE